MRPVRELFYQCSSGKSDRTYIVLIGGEQNKLIRANKTKKASPRWLRDLFQQIPSELPVIHREYQNGMYSSLPYFLRLADSRRV